MSKEKQIEKQRGELYGSFSLNMTALTRCIEAMVSQSIQQQVKLPDSFGSMVLVQVKLLREAFQYNEDNLLDAHNYLDRARKISEEETK